MRNKNNDTWSDLCMKRPVIKPPSVSDLLGRRRRDIEFDDDLFGEDDIIVPVAIDSLDLAVQFRYFR